MNLVLLLPLGLAALAALLLPLLLHLARRSEQRQVPFAALRWLRTATRPQRRRRFEERLLLALRLVLLATLALLLAQPVLFGHPDRTPRVAVAPGVDLATARRLAGDGPAHWLRLAPGFPRLDPARPGAATDLGGPQAEASLPSLLRQLDAELPEGTALTVVVPAVLDDADAQRPVLARRVQWRVAPAADAAPRARDAASPHVPRLALQVRHAPDRAAALPYLRAAGAAWAQADAGTRAGRADPHAGPHARPDASPGRAEARANPVRVAPSSQPFDQARGAGEALAWLAPDPVPDAVRAQVARGATLLLDAQADWPGFEQAASPAWHDAEGVLARAIRVGRGRVIRLERPLLPASMPVLLEPDFPRQLRALLAGEPPAPARVEAKDYAPAAGAPPWPERPRPLSSWLVLLVAVLFLLERWVASGPRRGTGT